MHILAKPVLLEVTWVSIRLCVLCYHGVEHMCTCRVYMRVFASVCQEVKREAKRPRRQKAVMIWGEQGDMGWESLATGLTGMDKLIIEAS